MYPLAVVAILLPKKDLLRQLFVIMEVFDVFVFASIIG
jgi:hypothetical protein